VTPNAKYLVALPEKRDHREATGSKQRDQQQCSERAEFTVHIATVSFCPQLNGAK